MIPLSEEELIRFGQNILLWSGNHPRPLPWKNFSDPYHIWIAEIILQQTRVAQGSPYFEKFIQHFPDLKSLGMASIEEVLIVWEGLGYYSRARNLHDTAHYLLHELGGRFPESSTGLQQLKGIGPYTAAAIASFAFGEEIGVVDGNVKRVVSRYFNISDEIDSPAAKKYIQALVNQVVSYFPSPEFNQAIMNFGAMMCVPAQPDCLHCTARDHCSAYRLNQVDQLPVKSRSQPKKVRWLCFGIYISEGRIALAHNQSSNIWKNLYLFPLVGSKTDFKRCMESNERGERPDFELIMKMEWALTHRALNIYFFHVTEWPSGWDQNEEIMLVDIEKLDNFALPRPLRLFLNENSCKLGLNKNYDQ